MTARALGTIPVSNFSFGGANRLRVSIKLAGVVLAEEKRLESTIRLAWFVPLGCQPGAFSGLDATTISTKHDSRCWGHDPVSNFQDQGFVPGW